VAKPEAARSTLSTLALSSLLCALVVGSTTPTPLWPLYQVRLGFGAGTTTLLFTCYLAAVVPATLIAGPQADRFGRRWPVTVSVLLAGVALWVLATASSVGGLVAGRLLQGMAVGSGGPPLTSGLLAIQPRANRTAASLFVTVALTGAAGLGPVLSGALASGGQPIRAYAAAGGLLALTAFPALALLPAGERGERRKSNGRRYAFLDDPADRRRLAGASVRSLLAWGIAYVSLALAPSFAIAITQRHDLLLVGAPGGVLLIISAVVQVLAARFKTPSITRLGLLALASGFVVLGIAPFAPSIEIVLVALAVLGIGHGLVFMTALRTAAATAAPDGKGATAAVFFTVTYLGGGLTVLSIGGLSTLVGLVAAMQVFCLCGTLASVLHVRGLMGVENRARSVAVTEGRTL
jgi:hypothetical protein